MSQQKAREYYAARIAGIRQQEAEIERQSRSLRRWRALTWLLALGLAAYASFSPADDRWIVWLAGGLFAAFVVVLGIHEQTLARAAMLARRRQVNQQQLDRSRRDWSQVPVPAVEIPSQAEAVARDLDLFGKASLFHWLCQAHTPLGVEMLRDWLLTPAPPAEVAERQAAVRRLATATELREELQLRGQLLVASGKGPARFLDWAESPGWLATRGGLAWCVRLLSAAMLLLLAALVLTPLQLPALGGVGLLLTINVVVNLGYVPAIHDLFEVVASRQNDVAQYRAALGLLRDLPTDCIKFQQLRARLGPDVDYPLRCLDHLGRRVHLAAARHSSLWGLPYLILQWLLLCDFHVLAIIETWQRRHGREARQWFEALAELEALASLACVAHDNPSWCYPRVDSEQIKFEARQLGHPLLRDELRVANDVEVGPAGTFLLVSGSNMSGKSTLLRSVGVNAMLAQAGAPICATACQLPPLEVATSMRIGDSLAEGVSFYMAELKRLKQVVDQADQKRSANQPRLLYLLDEILLGTNSAERHIAVVRVLRHLLGSGAIGAVSTHDLELATSPDLERGCRPVHFREQIVDRHGRAEMTFDYRMRPGVATTTNALKLLELVGLG